MKMQDDVPVCSEKLERDQILRGRGADARNPLPDSFFKGEGIRG